MRVLLWTRGICEDGGGSLLDMLQKILLLLPLLQLLLHHCYFYDYCHVIINHHYHHHHNHPPCGRTRRMAKAVALTVSEQTEFVDSSGSSRGVLTHFAARGFEGTLRRASTRLLGCKFSDTEPKKATPERRLVPPWASPMTKLLPAISSETFTH